MKKNLDFFHFHKVNEGKSINLLSLWMTILVSVFLLQLSGCGGAPSSQIHLPTKAEARDSSENKFQSNPSKPEAPHLEKILPELQRPSGGPLTRATDLYGPLEVTEGQFYSDTGIEPWAGPWLPMASDRLFRGSDSPLQKYDQYVLKTRGKVSHAAEFDAHHFYHPEGVNWAGRCDAWAIASLMEKEPILTKAIILDGVSFTTDDLKALLVLSYEKVEGVTQFGHRFDGDSQSVPEDIYPEQFHKILQQELCEKKRPIIMDKDPGIEVWNTPIYKAAIQIQKDIYNETLLHVYTSVLTVQPHFHESGESQTLNKSLIFEYTYDLYGHRQTDGSFKVSYGIWTGHSVRNHPDFIWTLPERKIRQSRNSEIEIEIIDEIISRSVEGGSGV